jgi:hypothetical protein
MMTDRELLEAAAKAADMPNTGEVFALGLKLLDGPHNYWNPLQDDGAALRLAVRLNIPVIPYDDETSTGTVGVVAKNWGSKEANTRRAIVCAAAEMAE